MGLMWREARHHAKEATIPNKGYFIDDSACHLLCLFMKNNTVCIFFLPHVKDK
jgi:hypothetical protein